MIPIKSTYAMLLLSQISSIVILQELRGEEQAEESGKFAVNYVDAVNDLCEFQTNLYRFVLSQNAGWVEHVGLLGKDSSDRRSIGYAESGFWRIISGVEPGMEISAKNVVMTARLATSADANVKFRTSANRVVEVRIDGDPKLVEKAIIFLAETNYKVPDNIPSDSNPLDFEGK